MNKIFSLFLLCLVLFPCVQADIFSNFYPGYYNNALPIGGTGYDGGSQTFTATMNYLEGQVENISVGLYMIGADGALRTLQCGIYNVTAGHADLSQQYGENYTASVDTATISGVFTAPTNYTAFPVGAKSLISNNSNVALFCFIYTTSTYIAWSAQVGTGTNTISYYSGGGWVNIANSNFEYGVRGVQPSLPPVTIDILAPLNNTIIVSLPFNITMNITNVPFGLVCTAYLAGIEEGNITVSEGVNTITILNATKGYDTLEIRCDNVTQSAIYGMYCYGNQCTQSTINWYPFLYLLSVALLVGTGVKYSEAVLMFFGGLAMLFFPFIYALDTMPSLVAAVCALSLMFFSSRKKQ